jgi:hypothetical protein
MVRNFLIIYQRCAGWSVEKGLPWFAIVPKAHALAHQGLQLLQEASQGQWATNPLATANQMQEDFIGRPSRISRRVHARRIHTRVMERSLLAAQQALYP